MLVENDLDLRNVFQGLKIKGAGSSKTDRLPVTDEQLATLLPVYGTSPVPEALFVTLADTGARLAEIVGLEAQDLDLSKGCLNIRHNSIRRLKTKTSDRVIPLSRRAQELLRQHQDGLSDTSPIFPQYARPRGSDAASAMLMKRLRTQVSDPKVTIHSLRHRMKDKLRNTGCGGCVPGHLRPQQQYNRCQLWLRLCAGGHERAPGEGVVVEYVGQSLSDLIGPNFPNVSRYKT